MKFLSGQLISLLLTFLMFDMAFLNILVALC